MGLMELRLSHIQNHVSHTIPSSFWSFIQFSCQVTTNPQSMINHIPIMPIKLTKFKHPSIFMYILFRKDNLTKACNRPSKQLGKQSTPSRTRSGEKLSSQKQRILAQARRATVEVSRDLAQARPFRLSETRRRSKTKMAA